MRITMHYTIESRHRKSGSMMYFFLDIAGFGSLPSHGGMITAWFIGIWLKDIRRSRRTGSGYNSIPFLVIALLVLLLLSLWPLLDQPY